MRVIELGSIQSRFVRAEAIDAMREALVAQARGECDTPMPMHLDIHPENAEIHIKSSYRSGGRYFAVKVASGFPGNLDRGLSVGSGMMLLSSAETGRPVAVLADEGFLTDARTAAVTALIARELGRKDETLGILGTGIQARLQAQMHAEILDLRRIRVWGRSPERVVTYREDMRRLLPEVEVVEAGSPAEVARHSRLIVTATAARAPLLAADQIRPGTHISAVGSDSPGKQELDPEILDRAALLLVDSRSQCERLGELQHATHLGEKAIEAGAFCDRPVDFESRGITVCDFTGLGVEDLYIAQYSYEKALAAEEEDRE
jgi:ornithine cyclodeaminase/alanine dehydrogenase-like protein (mu-crystallin family)